MRPGDKIRFLRSSGEGVVRNILNGNMLEVEIEDGFIIPVLRSEVVFISSQEEEIFSSRKEEKPTAPAVITSVKGVFLVFEPFNETLYTAAVINTSEFEVLITAAEEINKQLNGIFRGVLEPGKIEKIGQRNLNEFKNWAPYIFQILFFKTGNLPAVSPLLKKVRFNPATFFKSKSKHPLTGKEVFRIELIEASKSPWKPEFENLFDSNATSEKIELQQPEKEVDLHIEKLVADHSEINAQEILEIQIQHFEKILENAIATGLDNITFIHGVGNGVLRNRIHKGLSKNVHIAFFQDARKDKFGYGATYVKFK